MLSDLTFQLSRFDFFFRTEYHVVKILWYF